MRITRFIPSVLFGEKRFDDLNEFVDALYPHKERYSVFLIDSVHQKTGLRERLKPRAQDLVLEVNASQHEPKTGDVDAIRDDIIRR